MLKRILQLRKTVAFLLVLAISFNALSITAFANPGDTNYVFVDGHKFSVTANPDGSVVVSVVGSNESLSLDKNGNGVIKGVYDQPSYIHVKELTYDSVDAVVTDFSSNAKVLETVSGTLVKDEYVGQMSIAVTTISAALLLKVLLFAVAAIVIAGVTYLVITKAISIAQNAKAPNFWFPAVVVPNVNVFVAPTPISLNTAAARIRSGKGGDVYSFTQANALQAVSSAGLGVFGPEHHKKTGLFAINIGAQLMHYHTANRNGAHALYGFPK